MYSLTYIYISTIVFHIKVEQTRARIDSSTKLRIESLLFRFATVPDRGLDRGAPLRTAKLSTPLHPGSAFNRGFHPPDDLRYVDTHIRGVSPVYLAQTSAVLVVLRFVNLPCASFLPSYTLFFSHHFLLSIISSFGRAQCLSGTSSPRLSYSDLIP